MSNRYQNTTTDFQDCFETFSEAISNNNIKTLRDYLKTLSTEEARAFKALVSLSTLFLSKVVDLIDMED